jgi:predicted metal-dependent phosphotriesterase family hydrolase
MLVPPAPSASTRQVQTVTGPVASSQLGRTLMHEHVLLDFIGAAKLTPGRYSRDEAFAVIRPHLVDARKAGVTTLVDATPEHLGRDVVLLRRLSASAGVQIVASTGIYSARGEQYVPEYARIETAEQLARRFVREIEQGIGDTGIRAGVIKTGVNPKSGAPLREIEKKIATAAALIHLATGAAVECHTDQGHAAIQQLEIFAAVKAPPGAFIWIHAHEEKDHTFRLRVARAGGWVSLDGVRTGHLSNAHTSLDWHIECLDRLKQAGVLGRVLLSQDAGWFQVGEPRGGPFHPYTFLMTTFLPMMGNREFSDEEIDLLLIRNPAAALAASPGTADR